MTATDATTETHLPPAPPSAEVGEPSRPKATRKGKANAEDGDTSGGTGNPVTGKSKKSTKAEVLARVEAVLTLRIDGAQLIDIRRYASENGWGVCDRQLERYVAESDALLKARSRASIARSSRMHMARREGLYARALAAADFRTALAVLSDMAKLEGMYDEIHKLERELKELMKRIDKAEADRGISPPLPNPYRPERPLDFAGTSDMGGMP